MPISRTLNFSNLLIVWTKSRSLPTSNTVILPSISQTLWFFQPIFVSLGGLDNLDSTVTPWPLQWCWFDVISLEWKLSPTFSLYVQLLFHVYWASVTVTSLCFKLQKLGDKKGNQAGFKSLKPKMKFKPWNTCIWVTVKSFPQVKL